MKEKSGRDDKDLEWVRAQIMTFACGAHNFEVEKDEFDEEAEWNAVFMVKFQGTDREERLFCRAVRGQQHVRFWVEKTMKAEAWQDLADEILSFVSQYDVAINAEPVEDDEEEESLLLRLSTRAWIPNFSQRIFGLTFSNLMECKGGFI